MNDARPSRPDALASPMIWPCGEVRSIAGQRVGFAGLSEVAAPGMLIESTTSRDGCLFEVIGCEANIVFALATHTQGLRVGDRVTLRGHPQPPPTGRPGVFDAFGRPLNAHKSAIPRCSFDPPTGFEKPAAQSFGPQISTGLTALNTLLPLAQGQRLGVFAGSGVGKTTLLRQIADTATVDDIIWVLIGERGREIADLQAYAARQNRRQTLFVATADRPAMERLRALETGLAQAAALRAAGRHVLLIVDSISRYADGLRDVALAQGAPLTPSGWPASLAADLAKPLEVCGRAAGGGSITAVLSVLVQGSDMDEPLADLLRGLLDGHIVLDRGLFEAGCRPAIDMLRSLSRSTEHVLTDDQSALLRAALSDLSEAQRISPLRDAGLYVAGEDAHLDATLARAKSLDEQLRAPSASIVEAFEGLGEILAQKPQ